MNNKWLIVIILGLGLLTRFIFFGYPNQTVFDEVHFGKFVSGYYTGEYFFDIHPPLGKLGIAWFAKLFDFQPGFAFAEIGNQFPDKQYMILRFLPTLAGALLPLIIFLLLLELKFSRYSALLGALLIVFENALITQSHFILLDPFLLLFGFLAFLFYFKFKNNPHSLKNIILFGIFSGLTISVKWTGLSFLALPLAFEFFTLIQEFNLKQAIRSIGYPLAIALTLYFIIFCTHLIILNKTGPGDAFMSLGFQKTLEGSAYADNPAKPANLFQKFSQLNIEMYKANQRLEATHPYSSPWYTWPLMTRPIYYWVKNNPTNPDLTARIYLLGNPVIWWLSTLAVVIFISKFFNNIKDFFRDQIAMFLLSGYILNILPFVGVKRVMFLYHYFTAYIFAILILVYLFSKYIEKAQWKKIDPRTIASVTITVIILLFIFFAPLTYGLYLSPREYNARTWFQSWI